MPKNAYPRKRRFIQADYSVFTSQSWKLLPDAAKALWIDLRLQNNGSNNGRITATDAVMRRQGWTSKSKLSTALRKLIEHGFVTYTRKALPNCFHKASLLRFTDIPCPPYDAEGVSGVGATNDYLTVQPPPRKQRGLGRRAPRAAAQENSPAPKNGAEPPLSMGEKPPHSTGIPGSKPPLSTGNAKGSQELEKSFSSKDLHQKRPINALFPE